jgi:hypothetical protein
MTVASVVSVKSVILNMGPSRFPGQRLARPRILRTRMKGNYISNTCLRSYRGSLTSLTPLTQPPFST